MHKSAATIDRSATIRLFRIQCASQTTYMLIMYMYTHTQQRQKSIEAQQSNYSFEISHIPGTYIHVNTCTCTQQRQQSIEAQQSGYSESNAPHNSLVSASWMETLKLLMRKGDDSGVYVYVCVYIYMREQRRLYVRMPVMKTLKLLMRKGDDSGMYVVFCSAFVSIYVSMR